MYIIVHQSLCINKYPHTNEFLLSYLSSELERKFNFVIYAPILHLIINYFIKYIIALSCSMIPHNFFFKCIIIQTIRNYVSHDNDVLLFSVCNTHDAK